MSQKREIKPSAPRPIWIDRFAHRLGELLPDMTAEAASDWAVREFDNAYQVPPEEAAEIFALELPPVEEDFTEDPTGATAQDSKANA